MCKFKKIRGYILVIHSQRLIAFQKCKHQQNLLLKF